MGLLSPTGRKAALRAILQMLPPGFFKRVNSVRLNLFRRKSEGNTFSHIRRGLSTSGTRCHKILLASLKFYTLASLHIKLKCEGCSSQTTLLEAFIAGVHGFKSKIARLQVYVVPDWCFCLLKMVKLLDAANLSRII